MTWIPTAKATAVTAVLALIALAARPTVAGAWLRPPYLYVVINGIILCIAVSSRFHSYQSPEPTSDDEKLSPLTSVAPSEEHRDDRVIVAVLDRTAERHRKDGDHEIVTEVIKRMNHEYDLIGKDDDPDDPDERIMTPKTRSEESTLTLSPETPLPELDLGGLIRTSEMTEEPEQNQTLESTWKAITEGRSTPSAKVDTWHNQGRQMALDRPDLPRSVVKSETFKDRTNQKLPPVAVMRREPSLSQDELNRRVEAFIKKVNDEMRLQRQESLNQYLEMIGRGAHS